MENPEENTPLKIHATLVALDEEVTKAKADGKTEITVRIGTLEFLMFAYKLLTAAEDVVMAVAQLLRTASKPRMENARVQRAYTLCMNYYQRLQKMGEPNNG